LNFYVTYGIIITLKRKGGDLCIRSSIRSKKLLSIQSYRKIFLGIGIGRKRRKKEGENKSPSVSSPIAY
jgi:hypothetical protein